MQYQHCLRFASAASDARNVTKISPVVNQLTSFFICSLRHYVDMNMADHWPPPPSHKASLKFALANLMIKMSGRMTLSCRHLASDFNWLYFRPPCFLNVSIFGDTLACCSADWHEYSRHFDGRRRHAAWDNFLGVVAREHRPFIKWHSQASFDGLFSSA